MGDEEYEFPPELLMTAHALIAFAGLDTVHNAIHRSIWEAFHNNRRSVPLTFKLISPSSHFPYQKQRKSSYEMHIPKGILKRGWMKKHLTEVPAVVVIFYELDWDDPNWEERKMECSSRVHSIRAALERRACSICVVLIQKSPPLPSGDDIMAVHKANALSQCAKLADNSLFLLPHTENLVGYTSKLEEAFFELASKYYHFEIVGVKNHREFMNKKTHHYLYVRHNFKMGFFSEVRQDYPSAHKYYTEAYNNLLDVRFSDTNEFEVKTVAGFICYKVCRTLFIMDKTREAISHFKGHIEHYKHKTGPVSLLFQHHAWLSKQFFMFAELFKEIIQMGYSAHQGQHPGFFYELSAKQAKQRKALAKNLTPVESYPDPDPLAGADKLEFFGQRPWRPCKLSTELMDPEREKQGIQALQYIEIKKVAHSPLILSLLGNANSQYKAYRCPRKKRCIVIQMAEELYESEDYGQALTLIMHTMGDYRNEKWMLILDKLIETGLKAAYLTASLNEYIILLTEALARFQGNARAQALYNFLRFIEGKVPEPEAGIPEVGAAIKLWGQTKSQGEHIVETSVINSPLKCKASIVKTHYNHVQVEVFFCVTIYFQARVLWPQRNVLLTLSNGLQAEVSEDVSFIQNEVKKFTFDLIPRPQDIGKPFQISSVSLKFFVPDGGRTVVWRFNGAGPEVPNFNPPPFVSRKLVSSEIIEFENLVPVLSSVVAKREPRIAFEIRHSPPVLYREWYPFELVVTNTEASALSQVTLTFQPSLATDPSIQSTEIKGEDGQVLSLPISEDLPSLEVGEVTSRKYFLKCTSQGIRSFLIKVEYQIEGTKSTKEVNFVSEVIEAFSLTTKFTNTKMETLNELYTNEPLIAHTQLAVLSPHTLLLHSLQFKWGPHIELSDVIDSELKDLVLKHGEGAACLAAISAPAPTQQSAHIASIHIRWSRKGVDEMAETVVNLPEMKINETLVSMKFETPSMGALRSLFPLKWSIINHSSTLYSIELNMEPSDSFMVSGYKQLTFQVPPQSKTTLCYNLFPLLTGQLALPKFSLTSLVEGLDEKTLLQAMHRSLPRSIFVLPKETP